MKLLLLVLSLLFVVNCGNKKFSGGTVDKSTDNNTIDDDFLDDNTDDDDIPDIVDDDDDGGQCPRYDLVVKSVHKTNKKLNFSFTFDGEMTFKSIQGLNKIQFSTAKYSSCSGNYTNTSIATNLVPLQAVEDLTGEVLITHDAACATADRVITISVLDGVTNAVLFSEQNLRNDFGNCEFGYTAAGKTLRTKLIGLADGVANAKGSACD